MIDFQGWPVRSAQYLLVVLTLQANLLRQL